MSGTRLSAGPLGPPSTFSTRREQKVRSAAAIIEACRAVLEEGNTRPSIMNVIKEGFGFSETTLNRKRYKPILHAAQQRYEARSAGTWEEGDEDWFSLMEDVIAKGYWIPPAQPATHFLSGETDTSAMISDAAATPGLSGDRQGLSPLEIELATLRARVDRLDSELARRDQQLYHALQTCQLWSRTIRRLRAVIADLNGEINTIQAEPWDPREQGNWMDEEDDDWPEHE